MRARLVAIVLACCIPAIAFAQKKGSAGSDPDNSPAASSGGSSMPKTPTARELSDMNPATLLIGKRKKLSLADSQVTQLKAVEKAISGRNAQFMTQYDSIHKWTQPLAASVAPRDMGADNQRAASGSSAAEQAKMQSSLRDLRALLMDFRDRRNADDADALAVIPDAQKKAAADLVKQQDGDLDKMIATAKGRP
jgi:hypothetical protein